jgi:hypothetical protein
VLGLFELACFEASKTHEIASIATLRTPVSLFAFALTCGANRSAARRRREFCGLHAALPVRGPLAFIARRHCQRARALLHHGDRDERGASQGSPYAKAHAKGSTIQPLLQTSAQGATISRHSGISKGDFDVGCDC